MIDNRPDLPELESVDLCRRNYAHGPALISLYPIALIASSVWVVPRIKPFLGQNLAAVLIINGLLAALGIWLLCKALITDYRWKTDPDGLAVWSVLRKRRIRWADVREATSGRAKLGRSVTSVETPSQIISVPVATDREPQGDLLTASIWQHLRRHGKADSITLPRDAQSIWDLIPDSVPRDMTFDDPRRRRPWVSTAILGTLLAGTVAGIGFWVILSTRSSIAIAAVLFCAIMFGLLYRDEVRSCMLIPRRAVLRDTQIEAELAHKTIVLRWQEVTRASWYNHSSGCCLRLKQRADRSEIVLPIIPDDEQSQIMALSVIRHLRDEAHIAIGIPEVLRTFAHAPDEDGAEPEAEVRLAPDQRLAVSILLSPLGTSLVQLATGKLTSLYLVLPTLFCTGMVIWALSGNYSRIVGRQGIATYFLRRCSRITWDRVASVRTHILPGTWTPSRYLLDQNGRVLCGARPGMGSKLDVERYQSVLATYLARTLPSDQLDKPWKSKPWTSAQ